MRFYDQALSRWSPDAYHEERQYMRAMNLLTNALERLLGGQSDFPAVPEPERPALTARLLDCYEQTLAWPPHFNGTEEAYWDSKRRAGNGLAWLTFENGGDLHRALSCVEQAIASCQERPVAPPEQYNTFRDTRVDILLALGRTDQAYQELHEILTDSPDWPYHRDLSESEAFQSWRATHAANP